MNCQPEIEVKPEMIRKGKLNRFLTLFASLFFVVLIAALMFISLGLRPALFFNLRLSASTMLFDLIFTFVRVTSVSLMSLLLAVFFGWLLNISTILRYVTLPAVNFIRHISPFAWFPFAIIWFGIGEMPIYFILMITLFFPALISVREIFAGIPREFIDEAKVCGADSIQLLFRIELPIITNQLVNLVRILWGLGWTVVIAAEMLGTARGLGYRLLDFRYLLFYEEMFVYLIIMGAAGIVVDHLLGITARKAKEKFGF